MNGVFDATFLTKAELLILAQDLEIVPDASKNVPPHYAYDDFAHSDRSDTWVFSPWLPCVTLALFLDCRGVDFVENTVMVFEGVVIFVSDVAVF